ncbi:holo-ACP synthase [Thalassotalea sp. LPB0316]|uniref:holo-ACP synthase n=1 Tax=Thalassotalea sp. LPB0316 TaxID=2769490 RepID=UPI0018674666|nr:holo-ACP synthase [Thalassotalea sp. LPB0316]QOL25578.1 holo-ACP synthase [Thalassotalea sp. LPB0316]
MSVVGIGTDILDSSRIANMKPAVREKLAKRVLTPNELERYHEHTFPSQYLAKRWAAKEAASKALQTGIAKGVSFQHFEINNTDTGAPIIDITGVALEKAQALGATSWHISLADDNALISAFVVLSR